MSSDNNKIHCPHDHLFRRALADKRVAQDFLKQHLPNHILQIIDLDTLQLSKESYVDETLNLSQVDVLFQANFNARPGYIYLLLEHFSASKPLSAFKLHQYIINIMSDHLEKHQTQQLPIVYPMLFYHGKVPYSATTDLFDLFGENKDLAKDILLKPYQLIDITQISDENLRAHIWSGTLGFIFKYVSTREFLNHLKKLKPQLIELENLQGETFLLVLLQYVLDQAEEEDTQGVIEFIKTTFSANTKEKVMTIAERLRLEGYQQGRQEGAQEAMTIAKRLRLEGYQQGKQEGKREGYQQGMQEEMEMIASKMLEEKCGIDLIARVTQLPAEKIKKLQKTKVDSLA